MKWLVPVAILSCASCGVPPGISVGTDSPARVPVNAGKSIAAFCVARDGSRVGNGECWTLADEAFKAAGARRPGSDMRVWGRKIDYKREALKPGDVIEFESASFSDGTMTGSAHTAVVVGAGGFRGVRIAEQNWGKKTVRIRELDLSTLRRGKVSVYRPE